MPLQPQAGAARGSHQLIWKPFLDIRTARTAKPSREKPEGFRDAVSMRSSLKRQLLCPAAGHHSDNQLLWKPRGPSSVSLLSWQHLTLLKNTFSKDRISSASPRCWSSLCPPLAPFFLPGILVATSSILSWLPRSPFRQECCFPCYFSFRPSQDTLGKDHP